MARPAKPWYWKARKTWCVYHKGEKILLGPDRDEAFRQYHEIMAKPDEKCQPVQWGAVAAILDDFLTWTEENRAPKTYTRYRDFIQSFVSKYGRMEAGDLNPSHVTTWLSHPQGLELDDQAERHHRPSEGVQLGRQEPWPGPQSHPRHGEAGGETPDRRSSPPEEFDEILKHVHDVPFRDLLIVSYDSGSRPQETKQLEARHLQTRQAAGRHSRRGGQRWHGPGRSTFRRTGAWKSSNGSPRTTRRARCSETTRAMPWTGFAVKLRFDRIQIAIGRQEMANAGIPSAVTDDDIEALAEKLPKTRREPSHGQKDAEEACGASFRGKAEAHCQGGKAICQAIPAIRPAAQLCDSEASGWRRFPHRGGPGRPQGHEDDRRRVLARRR